MSYLCNARGDGTEPLPGRSLKLRPGCASPRAQRSAQAQSAPPAWAGPGPRVTGPGRARIGPKCRAVDRRASACMAFYTVHPHPVHAHAMSGAR